MRVDETERLRMAEERLQAEVERLKAQPTAAQERAAKVHEWILRVVAIRISKNELDEYMALYGEHWPTEGKP